MQKEKLSCEDFIKTINTIVDDMSPIISAINDLLELFRVFFMYMGKGLEQKINIRLWLLQKQKYLGW